MARPRHGAWLAAIGRRAGLLAACALALLLAGQNLRDEGHVSLHGDMARTLMNGAFLLDAARDWPFTSLDAPMEYARHYYARYPALSLGHHPPLLAAAIAPAYALFGVSVSSARLVGLLSLMAGVILLYLLMERPYGRLRASAAGALFASSPMLLLLARSAFAEPLAVALVLAAALSLQRFGTSGSRPALVALVLTATLSLYAKQLAVFVFPALLVAAVALLGVRRLLRRDVLIAAGVIVVLVLPLAALTLELSPDNVTATINAASGTGPGAEPITLRVVWDALRVQTGALVLLLAAGGAAVGVARRDRWVLLALVWGGTVVLLVTQLAHYEIGRYSVYAVPAWCLLAASVAGRGSHRVIRYATAAVVALTLTWQVYAAATTMKPAGAEGYEEAAQYVLANDPGPAVLFSGGIDTGFFTFFVRKHDPDRRLVVLRSDKVLTTSRMYMLAVEDRVDSPEGIYDVLRRFGVRFVVIEDRPTGARVLDWLRDELHSRRFAERRRIPIGTDDRRLRGTSLAVYEFLDAGPPDEDAVLSLNLPLVGRSVSVPLSDLTGPAPRR